MKKSEADKLAMEIFDESAKESRRIIDEAKREGSWQMGLDSNKHLFDDLHKRTRERLAEIWDQVDDFEN